MTTKFAVLKISVFLTGVFAAILIFSGRAASQSPAIGKSFDEVVKLAAKEGKVRVGSGLTVDLTPVSGTARAERLFNEVLAGVVEFDLYDVPAAMQNRFVKGGVIIGPNEWRKLAPNVPEIHFSPDGYFNASG